MNGRMYGWTYWSMDGNVDERIDIWIYGLMDGSKDEWTDVLDR